LTRSNMELKAFRDLLGSSSNLPSMNVGSGHSHSHFGGSTTGPTSNTSTGAGLNAAAGTATAAAATLDLGANPIASGSGGSGTSGTLGIATRDNNHNRGGSGVTGTSTGETGGRTSLVAGGYVHLGPVRPIGVDRYSDGGGGGSAGSARSASARLGASATGGSHHHYHHHRHHGHSDHHHGGGMPAGEPDVASLDATGHSATSPSAPGPAFGLNGTGSSNGGNGNGNGGRDRLASTSRQSHSQSDSALSGESLGFPPSLPGGLLGVQDHPLSHSLRRGSGNMPPVSESRNTTRNSNTGLGSGIGGHGPHNTHISDSPFPPYGDSRASVHGNSVNNDSSVSVSSEAGDADVENEGENSAQDRSESSLSNYPTTRRFKHVETENGESFLLALAFSLFSIASRSFFWLGKELLADRTGGSPFG
jgi:hypothetical protein